MLFQVIWQLLDGYPITPGLPLVRLDSCQCLLAVFPLADFLHQLFANGRAFCPLRRERFGPFPLIQLGYPRSFTPLSSWRLTLAGSSAACRSSVALLTCRSHQPLAGTVRAFIAFATTTPCADFYRPIRTDRSILSRFRDKRQISRGKFDRLPHATVEFTTSAPWMDMGFVVLCQLAGAVGL
jgi:hypothetical protein